MENKEPIQQYNDWLESRIAAGLPEAQRAIVTMGTSFVWISPDGIKNIEWSKIQKPELWLCPDCHNDLPPCEFDITATLCDSCRISKKEAENERANR